MRVRISGLPTKFIDADGLPHDLGQVPRGVSDPSDPERDEKRAAWIVWRNLIRRYRIQRMTECANDPKQQAVEMAKCERYGASYWITVWAWASDPREDEQGLPIGSSSFIPYPGQVELIDWIDQRIATRGDQGDGLISKSRDMGATTICCLWALHGWLFKPSFRARFMSRNKESVDKTNDPDTIFAKIDFALQRLPAWMLPASFDRDEHRMDMRLKNPENSNVIAGDATTKKSMRGRRATVIFFDEAAFIPGFMGVWTSAFSATYHRIAPSTESLDEGTDWVDLRTGKDMESRPAVLEMDWWTHIDHDYAWYEQQKRRSAADPEGFAREVERNPYAGNGAYIYEIAREFSVTPGLDWAFGMPVYVGIDPGFDDDCAISVIGWDALTGRYRLIDAFANRLQPPEYYASLLCGLPATGIDGFDYRPIGPYDPMAFAALMRRVSSFTIFGDPNGTHRATGQRDSWYERMNEWAAANTPLKRGLPVVVGWDPDQRQFSGRRAALQRLLPRMEFNDTPGARTFLRSLQDYRFENTSKARQSEQVKPLHNANSHPVASLEYIAVNLEQMVAVAAPMQRVYDQD